jgi:small-conductance mechanosensitive channel
MTNNNDVIDLDPVKAFEKVDSWVDQAAGMFPNFIVAIVTLAIFIFVGRLASNFINNRYGARGQQNLGDILGKFVKTIVLVVGVFISLTIVVPSLNASNLVAGLGVGSVAIGFAFKDILQNWLAGLLILINQPFDIGDQIIVNGYEGTVERIETRATIIKTYDGQKAVIPNSDIYTNAFLVKTAYESRRSQYDVGIGYGDDADEACKVIMNVLNSLDGVEKNPAPEAFPWDLSASWVAIRVRWWTSNNGGNVVKNKSDIIKNIKKALDEAHIDMPYETKVHLFHDQTEERDGKPGHQREGWPSPKDKEIKSRWERGIEDKKASKKEG